MVKAGMFIPCFQAWIPAPGYFLRMVYRKKEKEDE
jgi:hypothetical protein